MYELWMTFQHFDWHMDVVDVSNVEEVSTPSNIMAAS